MSSLQIDQQSSLTNQLQLAIDNTTILELLKTANYDEFNDILKQIKALNFFQESQFTEGLNQSLNKDIIKGNLEQKTHKKLYINEIVEMEIQPESNAVDFGESLPGSVLEQTLILRNIGYIPYSLKATVLCFDEELNSLEEYIFSLRSLNNYDYNESQQQIIQPDEYLQLFLALKSPNLKKSRQIKGIIQVKVIGGGVIGIIEKEIVAGVRVPRIECQKELFSSVYQEDVIRLAMKLGDSIRKYECKVPFKNSEIGNVNVEFEVIYERSQSNEYEFWMNPDDKVLISNSNVSIVGLVGRKIDKQIEGKKRKGMRGYFYSQLEKIVSKQSQQQEKKEVKKEVNLVIIMKVVDSSLIFCYPTIVEIY